MKPTELVRHIVEAELVNHPEISDPSVARSISTKLADPRLTQIELSPTPYVEVKALANILAESLHRVDWDQTPISDPDSVREGLLNEVVDKYITRRDLQIQPSNEAGSDDEWVEADPEDINPLQTAYDSDSKGGSRDDKKRLDTVHTR